ncbi:hypothetical protein V6N13_009439 [Hibiscus sabdariffa]
MLEENDDHGEAHKENLSKVQDHLVKLNTNNKETEETRTTVRKCGEFYNQVPYSVACPSEVLGSSSVGPYLRLQGSSIGDSSSVFVGGPLLVAAQVLMMLTRDWQDSQLLEPQVLLLNRGNQEIHLIVASQVLLLLT